MVKKEEKFTKQEKQDYIIDNNEKLKPHRIRMIDEDKLKEFDKLKKEKEEEKNKFWGKTIRKDKLKKPESIAVLYLRMNGIAEPLYVIPKNGMFHIESQTYHVREDCRYLINKDKVPLAILREDGLVPEGTSEFWEREFQARCAEHQNKAIKAISQAELVRMGYDDNKMKINPKIIIVLVILAIVGYAIFKGGLVS